MRFGFLESFGSPLFVDGVEYFCIDTAISSQAMNILVLLLSLASTFALGAKTRVVTYSSAEFDVFSELLPASGTASTTSAKNSLFNAPLHDIRDPSNIVGLVTIQQSNMLRLGYNVQDFVDSFHFLDSNYAGGSSITIMSSFASPSSVLSIALPPGVYNFLSVSGSGAYAGKEGVGKKVMLNITNTDLRVVTIYDH